MSAQSIDTDFLVVGAGPAGSSLACFLGQNGLEGIVISSAPGTADTPRAHATNPPALECLRDIGLERDCLSLATRGLPVQSHRWCRSMVGVEYGKVQFWGGHPDNARDVATASPCEYVDLPQSDMEPLLVKYASQHGFQVRFGTELVDARRQTDFVACTVRDSIAQLTYTMRAKFLFGADGGRSMVARSFDTQFLREPSQGVACNILLNADLNHLMNGREAQLHWIMQPDRKSRFGTAPTMRMVRPWTQWLLVFFAPGTGDDPFRGTSPRSPELIGRVREIIGDESVDVEILRIDPWVTRETVAEKYSSGDNVFLLGDAAHRHPPAYGLGSNTCIQDAYNLGWKVAYVSKGLAGPALLKSYHEERQPVGASLVKESNQCLRDHMRVWEALGMSTASAEEGRKHLEELYAPTPAGAASRLRLDRALRGKRREGESLGLGMNQRYVSGAVYLDDETAPCPVVEGDPIVKVRISTYPGVRLPHAWLDVASRKKEVSTHDLAGRGCFCLFTGHGGGAWKQATKNISAATGIPIKAYSIGLGLEWHDVYRQWSDVREVDEDGCILVRPDRFVAWRSMRMISDCERKLWEVLDKVLARG